MVRVPKLPLSMVAVASNTPSSISDTDIGVRTASLELFSVFARQRATQRPYSCRSTEEKSLNTATAIDGSGRAPRDAGKRGSHYRRPPDTDRARLVVTRWNGTRGSAWTAPFCSG